MIICAALKDTRTGQLFCGVRHSDIYEMLHNMTYKSKYIEGFVDNRNNFYNRHEAFMWTQQIGQLPETVLEYKKDHSENELYSEDLKKKKKHSMILLIWALVKYAVSPLL